MSLRSTRCSPGFRRGLFVQSPRCPAIVVLLLALVAGGCAATANPALVSARRRLAAKDYAAAHRDLLLAAQQPRRLSADERREVNDDLCLTEFMIGPPSYPLSEEQLTCSRAAKVPGSESRPTLARVEETMRFLASRDVEDALARKDLVRAEAAALRYEAIPGGDPRLVAGWSRQIWQIVHERDRAAERSHRRLGPAISKLSRQYPRIRRMNEATFRSWIIKNATVSGMPLLSSLAIHRNTLELWVSSRKLPAVAVNLSRFTAINDALVARCRCDGRTNITVRESGLPAYLLRLDPNTRQSQILILPHG